MRKIFSILTITFLYTQNVLSDNFIYNSFNNHGSIGLINMPSARLYDEASFGVTAYSGSPDKKVTLTAFPYNWLEASFFYMDISNRIICRNNQYGDSFCQGYKDKGFNFKIRPKWKSVFLMP